MGKRIFILLGIAIALFVAGLVLLTGIVTILYHYKIDPLDSPVVAALIQEKTLIKPSEPSPFPLATLTDTGNYQSENNWLATTIAQEIAGLAWLTVHPKDSVPQFQIKATVDPQKSLVHLEINGWSPGHAIAVDLTPTYAWDPDGYTPLARQLIGDQKAVEPAGADTPDILNDLLTPTGKVLAQQDVELSHQLLQAPASANLHDKAALLLLTLAWREHAGKFSDPRILLCRATAHLAVAKALRGESQLGWPGKIAGATLCTLAGREAAALQELDALSGQGDATNAAKIWIRALKLGNKLDWRMETPDGKTPLLLKIIWFQAVTANEWDTIASSKLNSLAPLEEIPDWGRLLLPETAFTSVDVGHRFCQSTLGLEFRELMEILTVENEPFDPKTVTLAKVFNDPRQSTVFATPSGSNDLNIIGAPVFKDIALRHLFSVICATHFWLLNGWGVPDQDAQFVSQMTKLFQGVPHERYLTIFLETKSSGTRPTSNGVQADVTDMPPSLAFWTLWLGQNTERLVAYFAWGIPFNAPYNMSERASVLGAVQPGCAHVHKEWPPPPTFADLRPLAPDSYEIASWVITDRLNRGGQMTRDEEMALLSPFFEYNPYAINYFQSVASSQGDMDDANREVILRKQSAFDAGYCFDLGDFLRARGRIDEAAAAYRQGVNDAKDRVLVSDKVQPLVEYDFDHGQQDEAMRLAQEAADVYSAAGIQTYAWLLCRLNRFDEAEQWQQKAQDRYGGDYMSRFYAAHKDHFPDKYKTAEQAYFPNGLQEVNLASFTAPPKAGCIIQDSDDLLQIAGLQKGDVIVALDSHAVTSRDTYGFICDLRAC